MPLITLLAKGAIVPNDDQQKEDIGDSVPIDYILNWFTRRQNKTGAKNRVLVLKSATGSGKSTLFPATLFKETYNEVEDRGIAVTQPRILNTINIVRDQLCGSEHYPFLELGVNIGWQTRVDKKLPKYGLTYMTIGTLTQQLITLTDREIISKYKYIIIDEVHEASLEQTLLLVHIKNFLRRNENSLEMPFIVLASATLEKSKSLAYFGLDNNNYIYVTGFSYDLERQWLFEHGIKNYLAVAAVTALKLHMENLDDDVDNRDILIFLPGGLEIDNVKAKLVNANMDLVSKGKPPFIILSVNSEAVNSNNYDYNSANLYAGKLSIKISGKVYTPFRKIILATSVAETGVTIDTLKYVVDPGYHRGPEHQAWLDADGVLTKPAQLSRLAQRMGRANRKSKGIYVPLFPKYIYERLSPRQFADIKVSDVSPLFTNLCVERVKGHGKLDFDFDIMDKLPNDSMWNYVEKSYVLGLVDNESDYKYVEPVEEEKADLLDKTLAEKGEPKLNLTRLGAISSWFMLRPETFKMITSGFAWGVDITDLVSIGVFIETPPSKWIAANSKDNFGVKKNFIKRIGRGKKPPVPQEEVDWAYVYSMALDATELRLDLENKSKADYYKMKYYIADEFIHGILLSNMIKRVIENESDPLKFISSIKDACMRAKISYRAVMDFLTARDDIINNLIYYGINIDHGQKLWGVLSEDFEAHITNIKQCIYEGFKLNLIEYNEAENKYVNKYGMPLKVPELFKDNALGRATKKIGGVAIQGKPKYAVVSNFTIKEDRKNPGMYVLRANYASYLDGYVNTDLNINQY